MPSVRSSAGVNQPQTRVAGSRRSPDLYRSNPGGEFVTATHVWLNGVADNF